MFYKKSKEERDLEKKQKQLDMVQLEKKYEEFLAKKISEKKELLKVKYPEITTLVEGWIYGTYVAILDVQQKTEKTGKIYFLFENISESDNKYKFTYDIGEDGSCTFKTAQLEKLHKSYLDLLKRQKFNFNKEISTLAEFVCAHYYKLNETVYVHHCDGNKLNNNIKNLAPLEKEFFDNLSTEEKNNLPKAHQHIPEYYKVEWKKKAKDVVKMEYRALDLYFNHKIPVEKIAITLRNRMNKAHVLRTVKLYPYFRKYARTIDIDTEE